MTDTDHSLDVWTDVRGRAERRDALRLRAAILLVLGCALCVLAGWAGAPLLLVSAGCAFGCVPYEVREYRRRRAARGSLGRRWT